MNTSCRTAFWTTVFCSLMAEEFLYSTSLDEIQILNHTHVVFLLIAIIEFLKTVTGIVWTLKTKLYFFIG